MRNVDTSKDFDRPLSVPIILIIAILFTSLFAETSIAESVRMSPPGATCGSKGTRVNVAGCPDLDELIKTSDPDLQNRSFEFWCVDDAYFGFRFVTKDVGGNVTHEKWIGVCPYEGGINEAIAYYNSVASGGFLWESSTYQSNDTRDDDDGDWKQDWVNFYFKVAESTLSGKHYDGIGLTDEKEWDCVAGNSIPDIPGDPNDTTDGPKDLLQELPVGGALGRWAVLDCPEDPLGQTVVDDSLPPEDCNDNGFPDDMDIFYETSQDINGNGIPDECESGGDIPTLTEWGMIVFCVLLFGWMAWVIVRRRKAVNVRI